MGATDLETHMQRYRDEARDGGYVVVPFHVLADDWSGDRRQLKSQPRKCYSKLSVKACSWLNSGYSVTFLAR